METIGSSLPPASPSLRRLKEILSPYSRPLRLVICLSLMAYILTSLDYSRITQIQGRLQNGFIVLLLVTKMLEDLLKAFKWQHLLRLHDIRVKATEILHVDYVSRFLNLFAPSTISQDIFRFLGLSKAVPEKEDMLSSILMDRLLGMFSLVTFVAVGAVASLGNSPFSGTILALSAFTIGVLGLLLAALFNRPLGDLTMRICRRFEDRRYLSFVARVVESLLRYRIHPSGMALVFGLSLMVQVLRIFLYFFAAQALGLSLPLQSFAFYTPIVTFLAMLPISISGLGVREASFAFFFTRIGVAPTEAFLIPAIVSISSLIFSILPGGIVITLRGFSAHKTA